MTKPLITSRTDWTPDLLQDIYYHIEDVGVNDLKLDIYPNQIEVISAEQMIDAYSSVGMPVNYSHWSFGKEFLSDWQRYQKGKMSIAYEIVINTNPCISYLMEENDAITQALVIAHAAIGHNFIFKNNYLFKEWTSAGSIIDYMLFAKNFIRDCELKYGEDEVEKVLDAAHALSMHGVDKRKRRHKKKLNEEEAAQLELEKANEEQQNLDIILKKTSLSDDYSSNITSYNDSNIDLDGEDEENLIYFIYKNAPNLEGWKREVLRIVYKIHNYYRPQSQTQTLNEGMATFTHFYIMDTLEKRGLISDDAQIAWLHMHSGVIYQPDMNSRHYDGTFNPYALGFSILKDIKRICEDPTQEDKEWFPKLIGKEWREAIKDAVSEYRDESFIAQFLSPKLMRDMKMMTASLNGKNGVVTDICDEIGYANLRSALSESYNMINYVPEIVVNHAKMKGDRTLVLEYRPFKERELYKDYALKTINHVKYLWGYNVKIVKRNENDVVSDYL
jgi:spore cortex formation protein SpoVR/YcgB (stage V sporulation)